MEGERRCLKETLALDGVLSYAAAVAAADAYAAHVDAVRADCSDFAVVHNVSASDTGNDVAAAPVVAAPTGDAADAAATDGAVHQFPTVSCLTQHMFLPWPTSPSRMLLSYRAVPRCHMTWLSRRSRTLVCIVSVLNAGSLFGGRHTLVCFPSMTIVRNIVCGLIVQLDGQQM